MQKKYVRAIASYRWRLGTTRCNNDVTQGNSSTREAQRFNLCTQRFYNYLKRHHQPGTGSTNAWSGGRYFARKPQQIPPCFCYWLACTLNVHPQCLLMPLSRGPFSPNLLALTSRLTPDTHISGSLSYYDRPRIFFFNCQAIYVSSLFLYWSVFFHLTSLLTLILIWGDHCNKPNSLKEHEFICLVPGYLSIVQKKNGLPYYILSHLLQCILCRFMPTTLPTLVWVKWNYLGINLSFHFCPLVPNVTELGR